MIFEKKINLYIIYSIIIYIFLHYIVDRLHSKYYVLFYSLIVSLLLTSLDVYSKDRNIENFSNDKKVNLSKIKLLLSAKKKINDKIWFDLSKNNNNFQWNKIPIFDKKYGFKLDNNSLEGPNADIFDIKENGDFTIAWKFNISNIHDNKSKKISSNTSKEKNIENKRISSETVAIITSLNENFVDYSNNLIDIPGCEKKGIKINFTENNILIYIGNEELKFKTGSFLSSDFYKLTKNKNKLSLFKNNQLIKGKLNKPKFKIAIIKLQ